MNSASQLQSKIANALNTASTQPPNPVWYQNVPQPTTTAIYGSKSSSSQYNKPNIFDNPSLVSTPKVQEHAQPKQQKRTAKTLVTGLNCQQAELAIQAQLSKIKRAKSQEKSKEMMPKQESQMEFKQQISKKQGNPLAQSQVKIPSESVKPYNCCKTEYNGLILMQTYKKQEDGSTLITISCKSKSEKTNESNLPDEMKMKIPSDFKPDKRYKHIYDYAFQKYIQKFKDVLMDDETKERKKKRMNELILRQDMEMKKNAKYLSFRLANQQQQPSVRQLFEYIRADDAPWNCLSLPRGDFINYCEPKLPKYKDKAVSKVKYTEETEFFQPSLMTEPKRTDLIKILTFVTYPEPYSCLEHYSYPYLQVTSISRNQYMNYWPLHENLLPHYIELYNIKQLYIYTHQYDELLESGKVDDKMEEKYRQMMRVEMQRRSERRAAKEGLIILQEHKNMYENIQQICKLFQVLESKLTRHIVELAKNNNLLFDHVGSIFKDKIKVQSKYHLLEYLLSNQDILNISDGFIFGVVPFVSKYSVVSVIIPTLPNDTRSDSIVPVDFIFKKSHLHQNYLDFQENSFIWRCHDIICNIFKHNPDTAIYCLYFKAFYIIRNRLEIFWNYVTDKPVELDWNHFQFIPTEKSNHQRSDRQSRIIKQLQNMKFAAENDN